MTIRGLALLTGLALLMARPAVAQSRDPFYTDFSAHYDVVYHEPDFATSHAGAHFDVASTFKRTVPFMGPVGELGFNHFEFGTVTSVMGGVRLRIPNVDWQVLPYAQVLGGLYHFGSSSAFSCSNCSVSDFAIQAGGGLDFGTRRNDFRIRTQVDFRHVFDSPGGFDGVRFSVGIVLPLNK